MGAGVALQAKRRFPSLPLKLGSYVRRYGNRPLVCKEEKIVSFPTKHDWKNKSELPLIVESAKKIVEIANKFSIGSLAMTRPGCGNGGLNWENEVKSAIKGILDDRFVVLF